MSIPIPPGLSPAPGGPGLGAPAMEPPPQLVQQIAGLTGAPPDVIAAFLNYVVSQTGPRAPEVLQQIMRMPPRVLAQMLAEFAQSPAGVQAGPPPEAMPGPPPGMPPGGMPPGAAGPPPGMAGPPPGMPPDVVDRPLPGEQRDPNTPPGMPTGGRPGLPLPSQQAQKRKVRKPKAPSWEPSALPKARYGAKGPSLKRVFFDADESREFFAETTKALQEWRDVALMAEDREKLDGTQADQYQGDRPMTRAQPVTMANRIVGLTSPDLERLGIQADPWADDDETKEAAQANENYARTFIEELYRRWNRRATVGDFQPPLPRKLSGLATIEGGFAWRVMPDPDGDKNFPWQVDCIPLMETFARPTNTTRQVTCSLGEAYAYEEVAAAIPEPEEHDPSPAYSMQSRVELITWTDETHWCMALRFADPGLRQQMVERDGVAEHWVFPPKEHKLGRRIYLVPNPWDATPLGPSAGDKVSRARHLTRGIYAPLVPTIKAINQIVSALRSDVFKNVKPPKKWKLDPQARAQAGLPALTQADYDQAHQAGGNVLLGPGEDVEDIITDLAATPSGQAFMQSLLGDLGDVAPPVLGGRGAAQSGFDRFQASEAAGVLHVDPIIAYLTGALEYLVETILTDLARLGEGEGKLFTKLPYKVYRIKQGSTQRGGYRATLDAKTVRRNGPYVSITFKRLGLTERMQLAQLNMMLVKEHMKSRLSAMDELGIDDTERETARMLAEAVMESPAVVKAAMRTALAQQAAEAEQDPDGDTNWSRVMLDAVEEELAREPQPGAAPPGMPGMPSPAGAPGGGAPPPMPGSSATGLPPTMMGG